MPRLMKWPTFGLLVFASCAMLFTSLAESQQGGDKKGKGWTKRRWAQFEPGQVFPSSVVEELHLTPEQLKELDAINADLKAKLDKLLKNDQKETIETYRAGGAGEKGGRGQDRDKKGPEQRDKKGDKGRKSGEDRLGVRFRKPNEDLIIQNGPGRR